MKSNRKLLLILLRAALLGSAYYFFIYSPSSSTPKPTYIFNPAPSSSGYTYVNENKVTGMKIYLGKKDSPRIPSLRLEAKEGSLDLSMSNVGENEFKKVKPETKDHDVVLWSNALPSLDLQYNLQDDGLRSEIILKENTLSQKAVKEHTLFTIPFYLTLNNVVLRRDMEGNLTPLFMDSKSGEYRFHMEKPVLRDSKGAISEASWSLKALTDQPTSDQPTTQYLLTLELPRAWLYEKDRSYPVTMVSNIIRNTDSAFGSRQ